MRGVRKQQISITEDLRFSSVLFTSQCPVNHCLHCSYDMVVSVAGPLVKTCLVVLIFSFFLLLVAFWKCNVSDEGIPAQSWLVWEGGLPWFISLGASLWWKGIDVPLWKLENNSGNFFWYIVMLFSQIMHMHHVQQKIHCNRYLEMQACN